MEQQKLLRLPQVLERVAFKKSKLWKMVSEETFPQPIKISHKVTVWIESEIDQWVTDRISEARA